MYHNILFVIINLCYQTCKAKADIVISTSYFYSILIGTDVSYAYSYKPLI
jgi:hypothetical protein